MSSRLLFVSAGLLALAACGSERTSDNIAIDEGANVAATNDLSAANTMTALAPAEFATSVAASDLYEIESGRLAAEKATSANVKQFASMLVSDHQKSTADLKTAAGQSNPPIDVVPALDGEKQGMLDLLKGTSQADFDRVFIDQQKQAHQKSLDLLRQYAESGDSQALKDFATKASAVVQSHLDRLNSLQP